MLDRVANQSKMNLVSSDEGFTRDSVNKRAMSSYEIELVKTAKAAKSRGATVEEIAASLKMHPKTIESMLKMQLEVPLTRREREEQIRREAEDDCDGACDLDKEAQFKEEFLSDAEKAYAEMYGRKLTATEKAPMLPRDKSIAKSRKYNSDVQGETGGPKQNYKYQNSIWDSEVLDRAMKEKDNGERIREENASIEAQRQERRYAQTHLSTEDMLAALEDTELRKDASVQSLGQVEAYNYGSRVQRNGLSIFDNLEKPFERVAEKTEGEIEREKRRAPKEKDRSWAVQKSASTTKNLFQKMVDSMIHEQE